MNTVITIAIVLILAKLVGRHWMVIPRDMRVVDGDTIRRNGVDLRLEGFDAPEWDQPGGRAATAYLRAVLRSGPAIARIGDMDAYGRPVATVYTLRGPLAWRMAIAGHAHAEGRIGRMLTVIAQIMSRGLWSIPGPVLTPAQWRAEGLERILD